MGKSNNQKKGNKSQKSGGISNKRRKTQSKPYFSEKIKFHSTNL